MAQVLSSRESLGISDPTRQIKSSALVPLPPPERRGPRGTAPPSPCQLQSRHTAQLCHHTPFTSKIEAGRGEGLRSQFSLTLPLLLRPICMLALCKILNFLHWNILPRPNSCNGAQGSKLKVQLQLLFYVCCWKESYPYPGKVPKSFMSKTETPRVGQEGRKSP